MVVNKSKGEDDFLELKNEAEKVPIKKEKETTRFLGVWLTAKAERKAAINLIKKEISTVVNMLKKKKVSLAHLVYINNKVLLPRIEYRLQHCILLKEICNQLQSSIFSLTKNKVSMAKTVANAVLSHKNIVDLKTI